MKLLFQVKQKQGVSSKIIWQVLHLKALLEKLGIHIFISSLGNIDLGDFDLVHIFDCTGIYDSYTFYKNAASQKKRIVLTPFFIDMHEHYGNNPVKLAEWRVGNLLRRELMQGSHMLLLHSQKEWDAIQNILYVTTPAKVVFYDWGNLDQEPVIAQNILDAYQQVLDSSVSPKVNSKFFYTQQYQLPEVSGSQKSEVGSQILDTGYG